MEWNEQVERATDYRDVRIDIIIQKSIFVEANEEIVKLNAKILSFQRQPPWKNSPSLIPLHNTYNFSVFFYLYISRDYWSRCCLLPPLLIFHSLIIIISGGIMFFRCCVIFIWRKSRFCFTFFFCFFLEVRVLLLTSHFAFDSQENTRRTLNTRFFFSSFTYNSHPLPYLAT